MFAGGWAKSLVVVAAILLTCCGVEPTPSTQPTDQSSGDDSSGIEGEWWLVAGYGSEGTVHLSEPADATMIIEGSKIEGTAICNLYDGRVNIEGSSFRTRGFSVTEMACLPPRAGESEHAFLSALVEVKEIIRRGDRLTLTGPRADLKFKLHHPPPPPALAGTKWKLNGLVEGRGSYGTVSSVDPAVLILKESGALAGTTACRKFTAFWEAAGDRITVTSFKTSGSCEGNADQDAHVIAVLSQGFTYEIREQSLDLYELEGDTGLTYTTGLR